jgi:hypothetical protein
MKKHQLLTMKHIPKIFGHEQNGLSEGIVFALEKPKHVY